MKAIILSCGTGGGHNAAGLAIKEELERRGHTALMLNPYSLKSERTKRIINQVYIKTVQKAPRVFGAVYALGNAYRRLPFRSPVYFANGGMAKRLDVFFKVEKPDIVIMPHVFPAEIITNMKSRGMSVPKTVFVSTDYTCVPFTEETNCDIYITPQEDLNSEFEMRGIVRERLKPLGIPVSRRFTETSSREQAAGLLGLDSDKRYILVSGGSMGAGRLVFAIKVLYDKFKADENTRIIVICGSNEWLYKQLSKRYRNKIIPVRYTDKMAEYMRVSDIYITKPGGLSSTEGAAMGVPMVHIMSIPGCETANMRYFGEHGMSIPVKRLGKSLSAAADGLSASSAAEEMTEKQKKYINPNSARDICLLAEQLVEGV
ncbi:MAG: glycosyltransferase [Acutalibacteraceae bacterium]